MGTKSVSSMTSGGASRRRTWPFTSTFSSAIRTTPVIEPSFRFATFDSLSQETSPPFSRTASAIATYWVPFFSRIVDTLLICSKLIDDRPALSAFYDPPSHF